MGQGYKEGKVSSQQFFPLCSWLLNARGPRTGRMREGSAEAHRRVPKETVI